MPTHFPNFLNDFRDKMVPRNRLEFKLSSKGDGQSFEIVP